MGGRSPEGTRDSLGSSFTTQKVQKNSTFKKSKNKFFQFLYRLEYIFRFRGSHDFLKSQWQSYDPTRSKPNRFIFWLPGLFQKSWSSESTSESFPRSTRWSKKSNFCQKSIFCGLWPQNLGTLTVGLCKCCSVQQRRSDTAGWLQVQVCLKKTHRRWWMVE